MNIDTWGNKAKAILSIAGVITLLGTGLAAYHADFARAGDLKSLASVVTTREIKDTEERIESMEEEIAILAAKVNKSEAETIRLEQLRQRRERYLQTLRDLKSSQ